MIQTNAPPSMQQRYDAIVAETKSVYGFRIRRWRKSMSGCAWQITYRDGRMIRLVEAPYPKGPLSAAIYLHEVGHHAIGLGKVTPRCLEEYQAWMWSLGAMEHYGITVTDRVHQRVGRSLRYAVAKARRRGLRNLPPELEMFEHWPFEDEAGLNGARRSTAGPDEPLTMDVRGDAGVDPGLLAPRPRERGDGSQPTLLLGSDALAGADLAGSPSALALLARQVMAAIGLPPALTGISRPLPQTTTSGSPSMPSPAAPSPPAITIGRVIEPPPPASSAKAPPPSLRSEAEVSRAADKTRDQRTRASRPANGLKPIAAKAKTGRRSQPGVGRSIDDRPDCGTEAIGGRGRIATGASLVCGPQLTLFD